MAAPVKAVSGPHPAFEAGTPQTLFETRLPGLPGGVYLFLYEVSADGKRFLVNISGGETGEAPLTVVVNWLKAVGSRQ